MASTTKHLRSLAKKLRTISLTARRINDDPGSVMNRIMAGKTVYSNGGIDDKSGGIAAIDFMHGLLEWDKLGAPTFALGQQSTSAFAITDIDDIDVSEIRLPFGAIMVALSDSPLVIPAMDAKLEYVLAFRGRSSHFRNSNRRIGIDGIENSYTNVVDAEFNDLEHKVAISNAAKNIANREQVNETIDSLEDKLFGSKDSIVIIGFAFDKGRDRVVSVELVIDGSIGKTIGECTMVTCSDDMTSTARGFARIVCNLCLYLDNSGSTSAKYDRDRLKETQERRVDNATIWNVCSEIKIDKRIVENAREQCLQHRDPVTWKLRSKQIVRGHWKLQFYGQNRSLRKRIFVQPYVRGEDYERQHERIYSAK